MPLVDAVCREPGVYVANCRGSPKLAVQAGDGLPPCPECGAGWVNWTRVA